MALISQAAYVLFSCEGIVLCSVHGAVRVLAGRIDGIELERDRSGVDDIVPCSRWNYDRGTGTYVFLKRQFIFSLAHSGDSFLMFNAEKDFSVRTAGEKVLQWGLSMKRTRRRALIFYT